MGGSGFLRGGFRILDGSEGCTRRFRLHLLYEIIAQLHIKMPVHNNSVHVFGKSNCVVLYVSEKDIDFVWF